MKEVTLNPRQFLVSGGRLSMAEWVQMSQAERDALAKAGHDLMREQAELLLEAIADHISEAVDLKAMVDERVAGH